MKQLKIKGIKSDSQQKGSMLYLRTIMEEKLSFLEATLKFPVT